jgi:hypothetical protein
MYTTYEAVGPYVCALDAAGLLDSNVAAFASIWRAQYQESH